MIAAWRPLDRWLEPETERRRKADFSYSWATLMRDLERELEHLDAEAVAILVDVDDRDIRLDGTPRSSMRPRTPRVVITFDSRHGPLRYATDVFSDWKDNVRAITLGLQGLRRIDRFGIATNAQQYRGWSALGPGVREVGRSAMSPLDAARALVDLAETTDDPGDLVADSPTTGGLGTAIEDIYRRAVRLHHPDTGGQPHLFQAATEARNVLMGEK